MDAVITGKACLLSLLMGSTSIAQYGNLGWLQRQTRIGGFGSLCLSGNHTAPRRGFVDRRKACHRFAVHSVTVADIDAPEISVGP